MKSENGIVRLTGDVANDMSDVLIACRACIREMGRKLTPEGKKIALDSFKEMFIDMVNDEYENKSEEDQLRDFAKKVGISPDTFDRLVNDLTDRERRNENHGSDT